MRDPLDLGNLLVLQRDESGAVVQDDVAEVLEPNLLAPELREVIAGYLDLRTHGNLPHASAGEVGMKRRLHAFDRRAARELEADRNGGGEGKGRAFFDPLSVVPIQRFRGAPPVRSAPGRRGSDNPPVRACAN